ncbi:MAG: SET domain-containing protein-lysine N-methyltransferase [Verrucomicrobiota bacterium]
MSLEIRASLIHGEGAFASEPIPAGARVIQYVGRKITKKESRRECQRNNPFVFYLNEEFDLDGNTASNPARLLNHSCAPNCDAELHGGEIWIIARRNIQVGEEVTFNYGFDLDNYREYPCYCGAKECAGYIVAESFQAQVRRETLPPSDPDRSRSP